jgi:predicted O-linked N-acetylglucosamine transferase (SPINDLY family)
MSPSKLKLLLEGALAHHRAGRLAQAEAVYARIRAAAPANFDALQLSGVVAYQQGRNTDAAGLLRRALRLNPSSAVCEMRLGLALTGLGEFGQAEAHLRRALSRAPDMCEAWHHLGMVHRALGRAEEAVAAHRRAAELNPSFCEAHERLGVLLSQTRGAAEAIPHLRRVAELKPLDAGAEANLGVVLAQAGELSESISHLDRALAIDPSHSLALTGRALVLQESYRIGDAVETYGRAIAANPANHEARSGRLLALHYLDGVSREEAYAEHVSFGASVPPAPRHPRPPEREGAGRLRVGFLSPDLRLHSVAYFLEPLLAHLDPAEFEVHLYHDHFRVDAMSGRLRSRAAVWRHVAGLSHDAVEALVRSDALDILVDLAGHTGRNRLPIFRRRLAQAQVTYLGYPDTTGVPEMDFRLVDAVTDPQGDADRFHTEKLVRFAPTAWCYAPPADAPEAAPVPSLGGAPVTFGCFNNTAKLSASTLQAWSRILRCVPDSRLLLKGKGLSSPVLAGPLLERFAEAGVAAERIELVERTAGLAAHLSLYSRVDVALDTFPYHGTTTTCEALWMGVPVVVLAGDRHASRVGASLLAAAGHPDWAASDWDGYVATAVRLAGDPGMLRASRSGLRADMLRSPLLDHRGQARRLGAALRECWEAGRALRPAPAIEVLEPVALPI